MALAPLGIIQAPAQSPRAIPRNSRAASILAIRSRSSISGAVVRARSFCIVRNTSRASDILFARSTRSRAEVAGHFGIRARPTLMIFRESIVVFAEAGALPSAALEEVVAAARALDMDEVRRELARGEDGAAPTA
jgi:hypothetical protein